MSRIALKGEPARHAGTSEDGKTPAKSPGPEEGRVSATPAGAGPDNQQDEYGPVAERCAVYLHQTILRGDPFDEHVLAGWPAIMEFLLRETGLPEEEFNNFMVFAFREHINDEEHDHLNSVLWLNWAKDPAATLKKNAEMLAHRYGAHLELKKIKAGRGLK